MTVPTIFFDRGKMKITTNISDIFNEDNIRIAIDELQRNYYSWKEWVYIRTPDVPGN